MTNAEKQEIIYAVLAALATNSKTIAQLSPKQSLTDSDLFEVAGGSRVTYQTLRSLIREGLALQSQLSNYVTGEAAMMYLAKLDTETGTVDYKESPLVMLDGFKGVNGYTPVTGDLYYENWNGFQIWIKTASGADEGIAANPNVAYVNKNDRSFYLWTGSSMVRIGGNAVINDLVTGGEGDALSAEMGKRIKAAINTLLYSIGSYAFPNGRPTIDWGEVSPSTDAKITQTIGSRVTSTNNAQSVELGESFTTTIGTDNEAYIIDDDNLAVVMDGLDITSTAYNPATGVVSIDNVTGDIVIEASAITYIDADGSDNKLKFFLDCKRRGGVTDHWIDFIGRKDFALTNVTQADTGMVFNGQNSTAATAESSGAIAITHGTGTIEFVIAPKSPTANGDMVLWNGYDGGIGAGFWDYNGNVGIASVFNLQREPDSKFVPSANEPACASINAARALLDGQLITPTTDQTVRWAISTGFNDNRLFVGSRYKSDGWVYCSITIKAIRVYNTQLTEAEMRQNYKIDKKRYNIS